MTMYMNDAPVEGRSHLLATKAVIDRLVGLAKHNPPKALIMAQVGLLIAEGFAAWDMLENGDIEARFPSGERYLLAESTVRRLA